MPLTNPNKIVTEERLSEFYGQILPYMGGMPDVLANKFSKGDLYSTDEKMIGVWTDGKPLYQKTVTGTMNTALDLSSLDIENVVSINTVGTLSNGNVASIPDGSGMAQVFYYKNGKTLRTDTTNSYYAGYPYTATIQYTKTTDSPISIGVDTDYSTDEKIVGTDTDGSWVYQKTFLVTTASTPTSGWTDVPGWSENITNLSTLVKVDFSGCSYSHRIDYKLNGTKLQFYEFGGLSEVIPVGSKLTLQYTKTS